MQFRQRCFKTKISLDLGKDNHRMLLYHKGFLQAVSRCDMLHPRGTDGYSSRVVRNGCTNGQNNCVSKRKQTPRCSFSAHLGKKKAICPCWVPAMLYSRSLTEQAVYGWGLKGPVKICFHTRSGLEASFTFCNSI